MALPPPSNVPPPTDLPLPHPDAYEGEPREYARALMQRKEQIEREIDALNQVLGSHGVNASTNLLDPEGYPRADIDVYAIRHTRAALARLRTDHRTVADLLAPALEAAFARPASTPSNATVDAGADTGTGSDAQPSEIRTGGSHTTAVGGPSASQTTESAVYRDHAVRDADGRLMANGHSRTGTSESVISQSTATSGSTHSTDVSSGLDTMSPTSNPRVTPRSPHTPAGPRRGASGGDSNGGDGDVHTRAGAIYTTYHPNRPLRLRDRGPPELDGRLPTRAEQRQLYDQERAQALARGEEWVDEWDSGDEGEDADVGVEEATGSTQPGRTAGSNVREAEQQDEETWPEGAVAVVNTVAENGPAAHAGLRAGDIIRTFGPIDAPSGGNLAAIGALVNSSEGVAIPIRVQRPVNQGRDLSERVSLILTPRSGWGGRGMLGCHILPP